MYLDINPLLDIQDVSDTFTLFKLSSPELIASVDVQKYLLYEVPFVNCWLYF